MNDVTNLPAKTNTPFHKAMEASRPSVLSNVANATKHFFRFIIDKVERVVKRIFGKNTTGSSSTQNAIPIRIRNAEDMRDNASFPLDGNKNVRAHRASLEKMLDIYPEAIAVSVLASDKGFNIAANESYKKLSPDNQQKCIAADVLSGDMSLRFKNEADIFDLVDSMIDQIERKKQNEFHSNKEIKIILETPYFLVNGGTDSFTPKDCAKAYITACEAWQLKLQTQYNKKVTILPFIIPEDTKNAEDYAQTLKDKINDAYDNANAELAKISQKDREIELSKYINDHMDFTEEENQIGSPLSDDNTAPPKSSSLTSSKDKIELQYFKDILNNSTHKDNVNDIVAKVKNDLIENAKHDTSYTPKNKFSDLKSNSIEADVNIYSRTKTKIDDTVIQKTMEVRCLDAENGLKQQNKAEDISISNIEHNSKISSFLHHLYKGPIVSAIPKERVLQHQWSLYLTDFQKITEFSKENSIDIGEAVLIYIKTLEEHIFQENTPANYITTREKLFRSNLKEHLNVDTTKQDPNSSSPTCTCSFIVDLNFSQEFLDALTNSRNSDIASLVAQHGAANVILSAINI